MRLSGTKTSSVNQYNGLGDQLYDLGGAKPTLDLNFSSNESLVDSVTGKTLVDHTRQSSATYVDGDGVIRTAVTNLLLQSEDFSTTWLSPAAGIETNQILSPGGNLTADIIKEGANDTEHNVFQSVSVVAGSAYTISVYAKAKELSRIAIRSNLTGGFLNNAFNLSSNSVQREAAGYSCSIKQIGDGWYRCSATATANATGSKTVVFNLLEADITSDASPSYPGDGTSGIYLWGAQIEESSTVGQYVKTTSAINGAPRFDHDPTTGESLGLLVEESRQNLLTYSEEFDDAAWTNNTNVTPNTAVSPAGTTTADTLAISTPGQWLQQTVSIASGATLAFSVYAKELATAFTVIRVSNLPNTSYQNIWFDLNSGSVGTVGGTGSDVTSVVGSIEQSQNGFYRISIVVETSGITDVRTRITTVASDGSFTRSGSIYLWGAQIEAGSFPTSYIPTEGSTVTRAADVASITGTNFSSWYEQSEGTVFNDSTVIAPNVQTQTVWLFTGGTYSTSLRQPQGTGDRFRAQIGNTFTPSPGTGNTLSTGTRKACVAYSGTAGRLQVGSSSNDVTAAGVSDATDFYIGSLAGGSTLNGTISRLTYWPTRLSNDTLQTITV